MSTLVSTTLRKAADLIQLHGFIRGEYYELATGRCCLLGAIGLSLGASADEDLDDIQRNVEMCLESRVGRACQAAVAEAIALAEPQDEEKNLGEVITEWNDKQQEKEAVVSLLRLASRLAEQEP